MILENTKEMPMEPESGFYKDTSSLTKQSYLVFKTNLPPPKQAFLPKRCIYCGEPIELLDKQTTTDINRSRKVFSVLATVACIAIAIVAFGLFLNSVSFISQLILLVITLIAGLAALYINITFLNKEKTTFNYGICQHHKNPQIRKLIMLSKWLSYVAIMVLVVLWLINLISFFSMVIILAILLFAMRSVYSARKLMVFDSLVMSDNKAMFWVRISGMSEQLLTDLPPLNDKWQY